MAAVLVCLSFLTGILLLLVYQPSVDKAYASILILTRPDQAETILLKALSIEPRNQEFFLALVQVFLKTGQTEQARNTAAETLRRFPGHRAAKDLLQYLRD